VEYEFKGENENKDRNRCKEKTQTIDIATIYVAIFVTFHTTPPLKIWFICILYAFFMEMQITH